MIPRRPPAPTGAKDVSALAAWANQLVRWLMDKDTQDQAPKPLIPARLKPGDKPVQDGTIMYDASLQSLVIARDGAWRRIKDIGQ